ncbi:hypothetical protein [Actinomadura litoris]|uniref:Uncharacterized protein n=1 Tax=Actinomadura litoris TaxID=2678616 RepID=A0A7K1LDT5_9ACTN|nr:hypothetical protein [Actinomadura litoris]MUN42582.1 hypothetical protein [Actinomadura litoris]
MGSVEDTGTADGTERHDATEQLLGYQPLATLMYALQGHGVRGDLVAALEVADREDPEARPATVTCKPRSIDGDRMWFFGSDGEAIAPGDHITEATVIITAAQNRPQVTPFGEVDALYAAVRRRYPQIAAECQYIPAPSPDEPEDTPRAAEPGTHLRLRHGYDIRRIRWDGDAYTWSDGADKGRALATDAEEAADTAAAAFGITPVHQHEQDDPR